jgi:hypothetical protein
MFSCDPGVMVSLIKYKRLISIFPYLYESIWQVKKKEAKRDMGIKIVTRIGGTRRI